MSDVTLISHRGNLDGLNPERENSPDYIDEAISKGYDVEMYDPYTDDEEPNFSENTIFLIGTKHPEFKDMELPNNSTVIDPWRYRKEQEGVKLIHLGGNRNV